MERVYLNYESPRAVTIDVEYSEMLCTSDFEAVSIENFEDGEWTW